MEKKKTKTQALEDDQSQLLRSLCGVCAALTCSYSVKVQVQLYTHGPSYLHKWASTLSICPRSLNIFGRI